MLQSVIKKFKQFGMTELTWACKKSQIVTENCMKIVLKDITKSLDMIGISVSTHTIQCCLCKNRLYGNQPQQTPLHKPCHIVAQFNFAKTFLDKEICFWEQVLWNNKTNIDLFQHNVIQKIWHRKGEAFRPKNAIQTLKHEGCSMMFRSCFSSRGTGQ